MEATITKDKWIINSEIKTRINYGRIEINVLYGYKEKEEAENITLFIANAPEVLKQRDELLEALKKSQVSVEILINYIPTGKRRNTITEQNIEILSLIEKIK